jgi:hypothetical protein
MLSIFAQLYLQDCVSDSRISWGYRLGKKHGDVMSLSLSFFSLPVSFSSWLPIANSLDVSSSCFALVDHTRRLLNSLSSISPSICGLSYPVVSTKYHWFLCLPTGESPRQGGNAVQFFLDNRNHDLSAKLPCESCCSGFHVDRF